MSTLKINSKLGLMAALAVVTTAGACKTVSPDEMDSSLEGLRTELRQEMSDGDAAIASDVDGVQSRVSDLESRLAALEADLAEMEREFDVAIARMEDQLRFDVPVYFGFDDATVETEDEAVLNRFAMVAQEYYPDAQITVEGFTDPAGDESYNLDLGERRANAVAVYLTGSTAMTEDRVRAVSYGEDTRRLISNAWGPGTEGWENRRVVLVIDHDGDAPTMATDTQTSGS